jgi:hypothetical protein
LNGRRLDRLGFKPLRPWRRGLQELLPEAPLVHDACNMIHANMIHANMTFETELQ